MSGGSDRLRAVVVGVGARAERAVLPVLTRRDDVELVALVDINPERLNQMGDAFGVPPTRRFTSVDAFAATGIECDIGCVATIPWAHREPFARLLEMGLHVYCEKPLAYSNEDASAMVEAARRSGKVTMIGFDRRFTAIASTLKELCEHVGPAEFVHVSKSKPGGINRIRMLIENAVHVIDLMAYVLPGEWSRIVAAGESFDAERLRERIVSAIVRFESGATASFHQVRVGGGGVERIEAYGDGWTVSASMKGPVSIQCRGYRPKLVQEGVFAPVDGQSGEYRLAVPDKTDHKCLGAFIESVKRGVPSPIPTEEAWRTQRLCDEILQAAGFPAL